MNQDTRNILTGVGLTFLAILLIIGIIFSGSFLYYMGKTSNEKEIAKVEVVANTAQNTANTAIVIAYEAKNTVNDVKTTSDNAMKFVEKIAEKKSEVKVVYVKPSKNEENTSSPLTLNDVRNVFNEGMGDLKKEMSELRSDMDDLKAGQKELGKEVENMNTRLQKIENVNQLSSNSEQALFMMFGKEKYNKLLEEREKQKTAEKNISKYK